MVATNEKQSHSPDCSWVLKKIPVNKRVCVSRLTVDEKGERNCARLLYYINLRSIFYRLAQP